jgi:hypothetical protein
MCISADVWTGGVNNCAASLLGGTSNHGDHDIHDQALYPYIHQSAPSRSWITDVSNLTRCVVSEDV